MPVTMRPRPTTRSVPNMDLSLGCITNGLQSRRPPRLSVICRPEGAATIQPRATPWGRSDRLTPALKALKGRYRGRYPHVPRPFRARVGRVDRSPGRCPGLMCRGPFGAKSDIRLGLCGNPMANRSRCSTHSDLPRNSDPGSGDRCHAPYSKTPRHIGAITSGPTDPARD